MFDEPICNRCGRCCHYILDGKWKKCKNLVFLSSKITACRIWNDPKRIGTEIDKGIFCNQVENVNATWKGCPYNSERPLILVKTKPYNDSEDSDLNTNN